MTSDNGVSDGGGLPLKEKIFIGGMGALAPALATFPLEDYVEFLYDPDLLASLLGFLVRLTFLFAVGSFWVYMHRKEDDPWKVFQLGIVAPAMLLGFVNANNVVSDTTDQSASQSQRSLNSWSIVSTAFAQPVRTTGENPTITTHNIARYVGKGRWDWTVYIKTTPAAQQMVRCVEYTLHRTFSNPVRKVCKTEDSRYPFGLSTNGWGPFEIKINVELTNGERVPLTHMLNFEEAKPGSFLRGLFGSTKRKK